MGCDKSSGKPGLVEALDDSLLACATAIRHNSDSLSKSLREKVCHSLTTNETPQNAEGFRVFFRTVQNSSANGYACLRTIRPYVLNQTGGRLNANSRLSQLARQLGWAIRVQLDADAVDRDCLRNAANRFFYRNPSGLPPTAPASSLSSEPHSFSRVFTGAFLDVLAAMLVIGPKTPQAKPEQNLEVVSQDAGTLLIEGIRMAAVGPCY